MDEPPFDIPPTPEREEAVATVRALEAALRSFYETVSPEEMILEGAVRLRRATIDPGGHIAQTPPHFLVHAMEACCAYWKPWKYLPLTEDRFRHGINLFHGFEDPTMRHLMPSDSDLFEFMLYMFRVQLDKQGGGVWWMPVGRFVRLFGNASLLPETSKTFFATYGISLRNWLRTSWAVFAGTQGAKVGFTHSYAAQFSTADISEDDSSAFLRETSSTPAAIGAAYRSVGEGPDARPPLTWIQRRPAFAHRPLVRLQQGFVVPAGAYLLDLFGESLFRRVVANPTPVIRQEVGERYERYVEDAIRHHLPQIRYWPASDLARTDAGRSCDFVVELSDCLLLVECKAVILNTELVTRAAVLGSTAITRCVDGLSQLVHTAERIASGGYSAIGIPEDKPRYGIVATLGELPVANHNAVWNHAADTLSKKGVDLNALSRHLVHRPQILDGLAIEHLLLVLRDGLATVPQLFQERIDNSFLTMGEWESELTKKWRAASEHNVEFWKTPTLSLFPDIGW